MLNVPMDVLERFPVRKSRKQKKAFLGAVRSYAESLGYTVTEEKGSLGARNLIIGNPDRAKYLITAHYDTCARLPFPNLITPCNLWAYIGYQLVLTVLIIVCSLSVGIVLCLLKTFIMGGYVTVSTLLDGLPTVAGLSMWLVLFLMLAGPANPSNANDNTSGVVALLEMARSFPENHRDKVCFVLFDLEEAGLIGSASYRKKHRKTTERQIVLNLDCVGDGDHILLFPTKKLRKDIKRLAPLYHCCGYFGSKSVLVRDKGFYVYPSDQMNFPYGVGIAAFHKGKTGLYLSRIHTPRDSVLDQTNINILRAGILSMIARDKEEERIIENETV